GRQSPSGSALGFPPDQSVARAGVVGEKKAGQREAGLVRRLRFVVLVGDAPLLRGDIKPVGYHDPVGGDLAESCAKGDPPLAEVVVETAVRLVQGLLENVQGMDAGDERAIEPHRNDPSEGMVVMLWQPIGSRQVPVTRPVNA